MDVLFFLLFIVGLISSVILSFNFSRMKSIRAIEAGIKDVKEGRVTHYTLDDLKAKWKKNEQWALDHPRLARFVSVYYALRRFFYEIPDLPRYGYKKIRRGVQRAYRGWANEDTWALDHYLSKVIKESLIHLKKNKMGYPATASTGKEEYDYDEARWNDILDEMIYAFDLNEQIANGYREQYYPQIKASERKEMNCLTLKEDIRRRKGMLKFVQYYFSLWD